MTSRGADTTPVRNMPFSPGSPSLRRGPGRHHGVRPAAFDSYDAIESLLADAVVGNFKYVSVMMTYRTVSRRMRDAIDSAVDQWCASFVVLQRQRVGYFIDKRDSVMEVDEEYYKVVVSMEKLVKRAFGSCSGVLRSVVHLSKVDRATYYGAVTKRCVLCGNKMSSSSNVEDAENMRHTPGYVFAHPLCQRKHLVVITAGQTPIPKGAEPRDLHKELHAVSRFLEESGSSRVTVCRETVVENMSKWYKCNVIPRRNTTPLMVWLKPHSRVNPEDTLYGAFGVTQDMVETAVERTAVHWRAMREQSDARRISVAKKTAELTEAYEAELRVWMGKGKTRWRSIEDLQGLHESIIPSSHIDRLIDPIMKKCGTVSVSAICNSLHILSKTIDYMENGIDASTMDWLVRCMTIASIFGGLGYDMQYVERSMLSVAINNEARGHAMALSAIQNMTPGSIEGVKMRSALAYHGLEANYHFSVSMRITDSLRVTSAFTMTHGDVCKLKYMTLSEMDDELAARVPPLPSGEGQTEAFLLAVIRLCFSPNAGMARSLALERVIGISMFKEIMISLVAEGEGQSDGESDSV
jgi:hypothetical protein